MIHKCLQDYITADKSACMCVCAFGGKEGKELRGKEGNNVLRHRYRTLHGSRSISSSSQKINILTRGNQAAEGHKQKKTHLLMNALQNIPC